MSRINVLSLCFLWTPIWRNVKKPNLNRQKHFWSLSFFLAVNKIYINKSLMSKVVLLAVQISVEKKTDRFEYTFQ